MAKFFGDDKAWVLEQGGHAVATGGGRFLLPNGAMIASGGFRAATHNPRDMSLYRRLRAEDAGALLTKVEDLVAERAAGSSRHLPDDFFPWDEQLFGDKPANPEDAAEALRAIIEEDRRLMCEFDDMIPARRQQV